MNPSERTIKVQKSKGKDRQKRRQGKKRHKGHEDEGNLTEVIAEK